MIIDIHSHVYPRSYVERLKQQRQIPRVLDHDGQEYFDIFPAKPGTPGPAGRPMPSSFWSLPEKLAFMDTHGFDVSVLSLGNPWLDFVGAAEAPGLASRSNEELEGICQSASGRLYGLGVLPVTNIAAALEEVDRIARLPHLRGIVLAAKPAGGMSDDPSLFPLWERIERSGLPVMIHPHYSVGGADLADYGATLPLSFGFPFETTLAAARLILAGTLDRLPGLKLCLVHSGGTLPFLAHRLDACYPHTKLKKAPSEYLKALYYDALVYAAPALRCTIDFAGADRVMFGTDHPFEVCRPEQNLQAIAEVQRSGTDTRGVLADNARRIFKLP